MSADRLYAQFHGATPIDELDLDLEWPLAPRAFGHAVRITYRSDKRNGGGDGSEIDFSHAFGEGVEVIADMPDAIADRLAAIGPAVERYDFLEVPTDLAWLGGVVDLQAHADGRRIHIGPQARIDRDARKLPPLYAYRMEDGSAVLLYLPEHLLDAPVILIAGGELDIEDRGIVG